jgi:hypothetical protein
LKQAQNLRNRKKIESKMVAALSEEMRPLSKDYQKLLVADLVTAFENRLTVLNRAQSGVHFLVPTAAHIERELV